MLCLWLRIEQCGRADGELRQQKTRLSQQNEYEYHSEFEEYEDQQVNDKDIVQTCDNVQRFEE